MDLNGGVALEPEIFKSCLYARLGDGEVERSDIVCFLENGMLKVLYDLIGKKSGSEYDEEEKVEMRLVEYVCRYVYRMKNPEDCTETFDKFPITRA